MFLKIIKSIHIIFIICWMASLLYLPRIFVYLSENRNTESVAKVLKIMARRLFFYISNPSAMLSFMSGVYLALHKPVGLWFLCKMLFVLLLFAMHLLNWRFLWEFDSGSERRSSNFFRLINEIPTIIMIAIIFIVVMK